MSRENTNQTSERIKNYIDERILIILDNQINFANFKLPKIVLHLIPFITFKNEPNYDLTRINLDYIGFKPIFTSASTWHSFSEEDGIIAYSQKTNEPVLYSYVKVFSNGIIEAIDGFILSYHKDRLWIPPIELENDLINALSNYLEVQQDLGVSLPIFMSLILLGIRGYKVYVDENYSGASNAEIIQQENLILPKFIINNYNVKSERILRRSFDAIWKSSNLPGSFNYDQNGRWRSYKDR